MSQRTFLYVLGHLQVHFHNIFRRIVGSKDMYVHFANGHCQISFQKCTIPICNRTNSVWKCPFLHSCHHKDISGLSNCWLYILKEKRKSSFNFVITALHLKKIWSLPTLSWVMLFHVGNENGYRNGVHVIIIIIIIKLFSTSHCARNFVITLYPS